MDFELEIVQQIKLARSTVGTSPETLVRCRRLVAPRFFEASLEETLSCRHWPWQ
jgi:hypothetical protein